MIFRFLIEWTPFGMLKKITIGLPTEDDDEEENVEGEKKEINIEANILTETDREPVKIVEETMREQEPTVAGYLPAPRDEQAEEVEILSNENTYLRAYVIEVERKIEKMEVEKAQKAE